MNEQELILRTKNFALRIIRLTKALPKTFEGKVFSNQLLRAGTSVGANYRAACKGRSTAEFAAKLGLVEEEADECVYWLDLMIAAKLMDEDRVMPLLCEAREITAIMAASRKSVFKKNRKL